MTYCPPSCNFSHFTKPNIPQDIFAWKRYLDKKLHGSSCAPLSAFGNHIPLGIKWAERIKGMFIEFSVRSNAKAWYYEVRDCKGYFLLISPLGNPNETIWISVMCPHYGGFSQIVKRMETPFPSFEDDRVKLMMKMHGKREISEMFVPDLHLRLRHHEQKICKLTVGNTVEVLDKSFFGKVAQAFVKTIAANGHLIEFYYRPIDKRGVMKGKSCLEQMEFDDSVDNSFWVTPFSTLCHPVGWAREVGHKNDAPYDCQCMPRHTEEATESFNRFQLETVEEKEKPSSAKFKKGMKLEMVDPINLNAITVGTIVKVLRNNFVMIAVDQKGGQVPDPVEHFCVPTTSPYLLPLGFCDKYKQQLKSPPHHRGKFLWPDYLMDCEAVQVPDECFFDFEKHNAGRERLTVGNKVETVDILNPSTILPATVMSVAGHLVRVNFDSWPAQQDQWKYMYSDDIFPIGFCELVKYDLMPPKKYLNAQSAKQFGVVFEQVEIPDVVADTTTDKLALLDSSLNENADDSGSDLNIPGVEELLVCVNDENKENYSF
ncbi:lethal(3)malignant brain tumor-like protein 2 isoform X1 [Symsagittifera roscoffensis]|uniref:lethal(3)malignant brain tumor-like protein 2 isoform X1 n=1 Tax=Symsagittifera roscoffensis TaxID=84072 RepID=UPI00307C9A6B